MHISSPVHCINLAIATKMDGQNAPAFKEAGVQLLASWLGIMVVPKVWLKALHTV